MQEKVERKKKRRKVERKKGRKVERKKGRKESRKKRRKEGRKEKHGTDVRIRIKERVVLECSTG